MSAPDSSVLYDAPGPRTRRRTAIGSAVAVLAILAVLAVVVMRFADQGQLSYERWGALIDPSHESFEPLWSLMFEGLKATLKAAGLSILLSLVIGTLIGVARMMLGRWGRIPLVGLIELFRGLPVVITIYFAWRVLPQIGVDVSPLPGDNALWYLVIGLTAYNAVIIAEIVRAGVASLPRGQREAALAIGMTPGQTMRAVLLPQAFRIMLPALISQLVVILKDTSLAAILGLYSELLDKANLAAQQLNNPIQMFFAVALIFIVINYALSKLAEWVERRASRRTGSAAAVEAAEAEASATAGA